MEPFEPGQEVFVLIKCLDNKSFEYKIVNIFFTQSFVTYVFGAQKNCLIETVLLSTCNICFG